jgi:hypothetical protein
MSNAKLTENELEIANDIAAEARITLAYLVNLIVDTARARGVSEHVYCAAISTEGLLLAAHAHNGSELSFLDMAREAISGARITKSRAH